MKLQGVPEYKSGLLPLSLSLIGKRAYNLEKGIKPSLALLEKRVPPVYEVLNVADFE
jgi:hypothetical protein